MLVFGAHLQLGQESSTLKIVWVQVLQRVSVFSNIYTQLGVVFQCWIGQLYFNILGSLKAAAKSCVQDLAT